MRDLVTFLIILVILSPILLLVGGGIAMCFLYEPGQPLDTFGYGLLTVMLVPFFLLILASLIWNDPDEPDGDDP